MPNSSLVTRRAAIGLASLCVVYVGACGGAATSEPPATAASVAVAEAAPVRPAIAQDLWLLVPAGAVAVADVDLARVRQWAHYTTLRRWLTQYACVPSDQWATLLDRVDRIVGGVGPIDQADEDGVLLLRGNFTSDDASMVMNAITSAGQKTQRGFWETYEHDKLLISLLDEHTLLIAHGAFRDAVFKLIEGTSSEHVRSVAYVQALSPKLAEPAVFTAMAAPSAKIAENVLHDLARIGGSAAAIAKHLKAQPYWGVRANLQADNAGVDAFGVATGGTEADATALNDAVSSAFWQAGLFMRLVGLPPVLANARLEHQGNVATVLMTATGTEVGTLLARLEDLVKAEAEPCQAKPAEIAAPPPAAGATP